MKKFAILGLSLLLLAGPAQAQDLFNKEIPKPRHLKVTSQPAASPAPAPEAKAAAETAPAPPAVPAAPAPQANPDPPAPAPAPVAMPEYTYKAQDCEFLVNFPSEPAVAERCETPEKCYKLASFTKVFDMDATIDVSVTCNKAETDMFNRFSGEVMEKTLGAMTADKNVTEYETAFQQFGVDAKQAVLLGLGRGGNHEKIYTSQLWIGQKSVMMLEAELIGVPSQEVDDMFANIIRSPRHENWKDGKVPVPAPEAARIEKTPAKKKADPAAGNE